MGMWEWKCSIRCSPSFPIAVKTRTIRFDEMAADVSEACSFSPADLKGIIQAIADVTARYLNDGCHIEFEHFGTLSLGIACERDDEGHLPVITSPAQGLLRLSGIPPHLTFVKA